MRGCKRRLNDEQRVFAKKKIVVYVSTTSQVLVLMGYNEAIPEISGKLGAESTNASLI